jgi:thymidylate kinase
VRTTPRSSIAVELCGLPGSGKTTLAAALERELARRGHRCTIADRAVSADTGLPTRVRRRAAAALRQTSRHPRATAAAAAAVVGSGQSRRRDTVAYLAQWLAVRDLVTVAHRTQGIYVFEEGIVQRLWTLGLRGSTDVSDRLWQRLEPAMRTDLVVAVDVAAAVALDRLAGRGSRHSRTQRLGLSLQAAELERGTQLLEALLTRSPVPVVRVRGDKAHGEAVSALCDTVLARLDGRAPRTQ